MREHKGERRQALIDLLSLPDSLDPRRRHHLTIEGRADRHRILPHLAAMFMQRHLLELEERASWQTSAQLRMDNAGTAINS